MPARNSGKPAIKDFRDPSRLWPMPCPVLGVTGEVWSGKTTWLLSIDPTSCTYYDLELSAVSYADQLPGIDYVNVHEKMSAKYGVGWPPEALWEWWSQDVIERFERNRNRVCAIDPAESLEDALVRHIEKHPGKYGLTSAKIERFSGLMWGIMKSTWERLLASMAASTSCQCLAFAVHLKQEYGSDNKPIKGKKAPKGKDTLAKLASLFLRLERPIVNGEQQDIPNARVLKDRFSKMTVKNGQIDMKRILPPYIKQCTPEKIREYMRLPWGSQGNKAPDDGKVPVEELSAADQMELQRVTAETQREAAQARADAAKSELRLERARQEIRKENLAPPPPDANGDWRTETMPQLINRALRNRDELIQLGVLTPQTWMQSLRKRGVNQCREMDRDTLIEFIAALGHRIDTAHMEAEFLDPGNEDEALTDHPGHPSNYGNST